MNRKDKDGIIYLEKQKISNYELEIYLKWLI